MSNSQQLVSTRKVIASVSTGKAVNQDAWMTQWCSTNWGDLLQPAPLSISLLGSILIIASSTDDFSGCSSHIISGLNSKAPPGCPPFKWNHALHPDSFKSCLQQMVGDGYTAFETAHKNMEIINNNANQMPEVITTIVNLVLKGSAQDIADLFQNSITDLQTLSQKCRDSAHETETAFRDISGLAQEMVLACTYTAGTAEQALAQNKIQLEVLQVQKDHEKTTLEAAKATAELMKNSYIKAEEGFQSAIRDIPSGWDLAGMQAVESLTNLAVSAGNAAISQATMGSQAAKAGMNAFSGLLGGKGESDKPVAPGAPPVASTTSPNGVNSQPNSAALSDPGTMLVQRVLDQANAIKMLLTGKNGKPDWEHIRPNKTQPSKVGLGESQSHPFRYSSSKPVSKQLETYIDQALTIIGAIVEASGSVASGEENALSDQVAPTDRLIADLQSLLTSVNLILQQPGMNATGPATPAVSAAQAATSAAQLAVQNSKMKVDQTKTQLEASRASFEKAADRLASQQMEIAKTIGDMTQLSLTNSNLQQMLPVLKKAVGAFTTLRAQFSQLVQFFDSVASLLCDVMGPSVDRWVKTMESAEQQRLRGEAEEHVAGVTVSAFTRDLIYRQMMTPLKVSMLATSISTVYLSVSNDYILPAQRSVGHMLQFSASDDASDREALIRNLETAQAALGKATTLASTQISAKVSKDQKTFQDSIDKRLNVIVQSVQVVLPEIAAPVPAHIKAIADAHVADTDATKALQAEANPMYDSESMI
ncbi:hypothetical protein GGX14DRAFT_369697 [Mycena pura]|uniref:Uncharacterized protein n=1 Tax=Mycena pura TaxID=153505 RepID=A0AAD6Y634_9AGAR|nr:hypothetical protein GGX14DRAFT_369697 [Mycena pura]